MYLSVLREIFMPPPLKKLGGHIALGLSVRPFVHLYIMLLGPLISLEPCMLGF